MEEKRAKTREERLNNLLNPYVLICIIILIAAVCTYIIPAGNYQYILNESSGKSVVDPGSYTRAANTPVGLMGILCAIPSGLEKAGYIIFFVFIIAGAFEMLNRTGFTEALVGTTMKKFSNQEKILFPAIVILLSFLAATIGMAEEVIIFVPILLALCKYMGYDELLAAGLAYCGIRAGHINGMMNPFNVGIAQSIADVPLYSGLWYRSIWCAVTIAVTIFLLMRYAKKIKDHPEKSLMYGISTSVGTEIDLSEIKTFTGKHKILGLLLLGTFVLTIFGVARYGWYMTELAALFLGFGVLTGIIGGFSASSIADTFLDGAKNIIPGALIVGVAGGILVILDSGNITDTIIYHAASCLQGMPKVLAANGMYVFQWLLNMIIPSGSAQAAVTMPIMTPLSDVLGINRQVAVLAFHYGDGVTNLLTPACGPLMACLAVAGVPYQKWLKWVIPMLIAWTLIGFGAVTAAQIIGLGPV